MIGNSAKRPTTHTLSYHPRVLLAVNQLEDDHVKNLTAVDSLSGGYFEG